MNGYSYKRGGVIWIDHFHAGREVFRQLLHLSLDPIDGIKRIGPGRKLDGHGANRLPIVEGQHAIVLGADFAFGHIFQLDGGSVAVGAQDNGPELIRCL